MLLQITEPIPLLTQEERSQAFAIGIDLGTTNSVAAFSENGIPRILTSETGEPLIPSVVAYLEGSAPVVGKAALELIEKMPDQVVASSKRLMGRSAREAQDTYGRYTLIAPERHAGDTMVRLKAGSVFKTPVEVAAEILYTLKKQSEAALSQSIDEAVITVPAYFDESARQATKDAAALAGLKVLRLINEPTAAALAYGLDQGVEGIYAVYDLGGGTFDFSLLRLTRGVFQVLATGGDVALGGDDIDRLIAEYFLQNFPAITLTPATGKQALQEARKAKEYLSSHEEGEWVLWAGSPCFLNRLTLQKLSAPLINKSIYICQQVLNEAGLKLADIEGVILVGGTTRMPFIKARVAEFFEQEPLTNLDPDRVVALGAALQAEALSRGSKTLLLDVTPLSLGLETMGGLVEKIIPRNSPIPLLATQEFTTFQDGQTTMKIHVLQGERELVDHCRSLASFTLENIPPLKAGLARIAVTFKVDADGLLTVQAREETTHTQQEVVVKPTYGLTEEDYRNILLENAQHGKKDMEKRLLIETKVKAQHLIDHLDEAVKSEGDLLTLTEKEDLIQAVNVLKEILEKGERNLLLEHLKSLESLSEPFAVRRVKRALQQDLEAPAKPPYA